MLASRRGFLFGAAASIITAPAIVRAASLMPVKALPLEFYGRGPMMDALLDIRQVTYQINDEFLRSLFDVLSVHPNMTATQVIEECSIPLRMGWSAGAPVMVDASA